MTAAVDTEALVRDLEAAVRRYHRANASAASALEAGRQAALAAMDAGVASERSISDAFGLDRNTIRAWRGKARVR